VKILCPIIGGSGVEIYYQRLSAGLAGTKIEMEFVRFSPRWEYMPWLLNWPGRWHLPRNSQADVLHTNVEYGNHFRWKPIPWVVTLHHCSIDHESATFLSTFSQIHHQLFLKPSVGRSILSADRAVAVSGYTRKVLNLFFQKELPIRIIYNGIDPEIFAPREFAASRERSRIVLFFSGNPSLRKGVDLLAPIMLRLGGDFELRYTTGLRPITLGKGLSPNMKCLGKLSEPDLVAEINNADIILQPSRREGFGYSILEGMACGKPVVSTQCSSIPELVEHGQGGYLCEVGSVDQFVNAIRTLAQSEDRRRQMGDFNRQRVLERFSLKQMAHQYAGLYRELVGESHANRS